MRGPKKSSREKDITGRYLSGRLGEDELPRHIRYGDRTGKHHTQNQIVRTAELRATEAATANVDALPLGEVQQVFSQFSEVLHDGVIYLCVLRKTMHKLRDTSIIVGDRVRFTPIEGQTQGETITREGIVERIEPRDTVLTRSDSFKA